MVWKILYLFAGIILYFVAGLWIQPQELRTDTDVLRIFAAMVVAGSGVILTLFYPPIRRFIDGH